MEIMEKMIQQLPLTRRFAPPFLTPKNRRFFGEPVPPRGEGIFIKPLFPLFDSLILSLLFVGLTSIGIPIDAQAHDKIHAKTVQSQPVASAFSFVALGDNGDGSVHEKAIAYEMDQQFKQSSFPLVVMLGDNLYLNPDKSNPPDKTKPDIKPQYDAILFKSRFTDMYQELLTQGVEFKPALGNHDVREGGNETVAEQLFKMPNRYYTYREGKDFQFFVLDTMALDDSQDTHYPDQPQLQWLKHQLKQSHATWKIVYGHYPMYSSAVVFPGRNAKAHGDHVHLQSILEPLFEKYHVALYLSGHEHDYERIPAVNHVQYIVSGGGGAQLGFFPPNKDQTGRICSDKDLYCRQRVFHFIRFNQLATGLQFKVINEDGTLFDSGVIPKP